VESVHPGSSLRLDTDARIFLNLFQNLTAKLLVIDDMSLDNETSVVTSSISRFTGPTRFFECAHRGRVCMHVFIGVSVRSCL